MKIEKKNVFTLGHLVEKEKRNLEIYDIIKKKGTISRTELGRITGINFVSISHYTKNQIDKKLVVECGVDVSTGGRKPELIEFNTKDAYAAGIDIDVPEMRAVITNLSGKICSRASIPSDGKGLSDKAAAIINDLLNKCSASVSSLKAIGVSLPDGGTEEDVAGALSAKFGTEAFSGDRASCAAFGEKQANHNAGGVSLYIYSDLGRGVVISAGEFTGAHGSVARSGDMPQENSGYHESARYLEPWDAMFGLAAMAKEEVAKGVGTSMVKLSGGKVENINADVVMEAAREKDDTAHMILQNVGINLGLRIAYLVNLFAPASVILGGGLEKGGDTLFDVVNKIVKKLALEKQSKDVNIIPGCLGADAFSVGASALAVREIFLNA